MSKFEITTNYYIYNVENHLDIKNDIISRILSSDYTSTPGKIYKHDYGKHTKNNYWNFILPRIAKYIDKFKKDNKDIFDYSIQVEDWWFQIYNKSNFHEYHTHLPCNYSAVYYISLPKNSSPTVLLDGNGTEIVPQVKEGDIIFFPSIFRHTSPPNNSDEDKVVVAFNLNIKNIV